MDCSGATLIRGRPKACTHNQQRHVACRISSQFPASFVELNACRQTDDILSNQLVVNHLPCCLTVRRVPVPEEAAVWRHEHPHVYELLEDACYRLVATVLVTMGYYSGHLPF